MTTRETDLSKLHSYIEGIDKEITMILQSLQWDQKHLLEGTLLVACKHDSSHRVPPDKKEVHEMECLLRSQGYTREDILLPDPVDPTASTLVNISKNDIDHMIHIAALTDPSFQKVIRLFCTCMAAMIRICTFGSEHLPLTAERVQATYSADERRIIHNAVVSAMPENWHGEEIMLPSEGGEGEGVRRCKSKLEVLAELRNMRRRRVRYRGATASRNYSHVIRDLIKTQMEVYTGVQGDDVNSSSTTDKNKQQQINREKQHNNKDMNLPRERHRNGRDDYRRDTRKERSHSNDRQRYVEQHPHKDRYNKSYDRHDERASQNKNIEIEIKKEVNEYMEYGDERKKYKDDQYVSGSSIKRHREQVKGDHRNRNEKNQNSDKYNESDSYGRSKYHHCNDRGDSESDRVRTVKIEKHEDYSSSRRKHGEYTENIALKVGNEKATYKYDERISSSKRHRERSDRDYNESASERTRSSDAYGESVRSSRKRHREDSDKDDYSESRKKHSRHHDRNEYDHKRAYKREKYKESSNSSEKRQHGHSDRDNHGYERTRRPNKPESSNSSKTIYHDPRKDTKKTHET